MKIYYILILFLIILLYVQFRIVNLYIQKNSFNDLCQKNKHKDLEKKGLYSDKIRVKKYIEENYPKLKIPKTLFIAEDVEDLKNFNFPKKFVFKQAAGSRMSKVVTNKFNVKDLISLGKYYNSINFENYGYRKIPFFNFEEPQYRFNEKKIFIEEYLENTIEFRIMYVKNNIFFYEYIDDGKLERYLEEESLIKKYKINNLNYVKHFCKDFMKKEKFELIRFDFLISNNECYFGEITFTPDNCRKCYNKDLNKKFKKLNFSS